MWYLQCFACLGSFSVIMWMHVCAGPRYYMPHDKYKVIPVLSYSRYNLIIFYCRCISQIVTFVLPDVSGMFNFKFFITGNEYPAGEKVVVVVPFFL